MQINTIAKHISRQSGKRNHRKYTLEKEEGLIWDANFVNENQKLLVLMVYILHINMHLQITYMIMMKKTLISKNN